MTNQDKEKILIFWFRRDLRIFDNRGFYNALKSGYKVVPVFIFDLKILEDLKSYTDRRVSYIFNAISRINDDFSKYDASLKVILDTPEQAFVKLCKEYNVVKVIANHDYEPYAIKRDLEIGTFLGKMGIAFETFKDQVIFEKNEVVKQDGTPYTVFTPYSRAWKNKLNEAVLASYPCDNFLNNLFKTGRQSLPELHRFGFNEVKVNDIVTLPDIKIITDYHKYRDIPSLDATSHLSVSLRFGTASIRQLVEVAIRLNEVWLNELIWREFFMMILYNFPHVVSGSFKAKYDNIKWINNESDFSRWCEGNTGYPIVDAGMRELSETGYMHNRVRMITAGFLTKHLLIDWKWGEAWFAEKLTDYELSSNNGNWQWSAGSGCDAAPYFRVFNPAEQVRKFDPEMVYIKKWVKNPEKEYVKPIIEHTFARNRAIEVYKQSLL